MSGLYVLSEAGQRREENTISSFTYDPAILPLQEKAYLEIKKMIEEAELKLNVVYSETKISQKLDISRTPFRSALNRLAQDGLIDILPSRGFKLHEMTHSEFSDYVDVLCAFEVYAIQRCTADAAMRSDLLSKLETIQTQMQSGNDTHFHDLNNQFHAALVQMSRNIVINRNYHNMKHLMETQYAAKCFDEAGRITILNEHNHLIQMIRAENLVSLFELINRHLHLETDK